MCDELVPLGWKVAVEAEPSRFIDFGNRVLDKVLQEDAAPEDDWNAAVVFLGSNYGGDEVRYEAELRTILDRLAPRPTLLFTVTEYRPNYSEVNEVVRKLGAEYDNVTIVDWEAISATPGVLSGDRLHPTETGREVLAQAVAGALGPVSIGEGECLKSSFRNDSAANANERRRLQPRRVELPHDDDHGPSHDDADDHDTRRRRWRHHDGSGSDGDAPDRDDDRRCRPTAPATTAPATTAAPADDGAGDDGCTVGDAAPPPPLAAPPAGG